MIKKIFAISMLIVGTIIGAGFASGRELVSFFGDKIPYLVAPVCALLIFVFTALFLFLGSKIKANNVSEVNAAVAGPLRWAADIFLLFNSLIVLSGMLAGMDALGKMVFPLAPAYSILSGLLCMVIVVSGLKGILKCNSLIVPVIIVAILLVCAFNINVGAPSKPFGIMTLGASLIYVTMNMMLASTVLTTVNNLNAKTILWSSFIAALIMGVLIFVLVSALNSTSVAAGEMPVLEMARDKSKIMFYIMSVAVAISIFTTMMTAMAGLTDWLQPLVGGRKFSALLVLIAGLIVSNLGFENVVSFLYPVIGVVGVFYLGASIAYAIRCVRVKRKISKKRVGLKKPRNIA